MKLIPFPGTADITYKKITPAIERKSDEKLLIGPFEFTCMQCRTTNKFIMEGMIFRQVEFYCSCCGALYKVSNPAFGRKSIDKNEK
jgi:hypothetical protein